MKTCILSWILFTFTLVKTDVAVVDGAAATEESASATGGPATASSKPNNIILFMTDDQDVTANSIAPEIMPNLHRLFREGGMEFQNYYVSTGLCCPSRTTILRGQYCHNTEIFDNGNLNNSTYRSGGWAKFLETGLEDETIATLLQSAGYETAMIGKYMNGYDLFHKDAGLHKPPGWDHWMGLLKCMKFYGPIFSDNGKRILKTDETVYQTDFIRDWVVNFLTNHQDENPSKPFFLMVTPFAPHTPAIPAKRHEHLFPNATFPRYESFNPPHKIQKQRPAWMKELPKLTKRQINDMDKFYGKRLRSLQAVDEALESIANTLEDLGLTESTYFIYTSDNGQHFGDHRIPAGKRQAYETDVSVPFLIRGPGISTGTVSSQVVQSVDLGPTFLELAASTSSSSPLPFKQNHLDTIETTNGLGTVESSRRRILKSTYPMDGKSILPLLKRNNDAHEDPSNSSNSSRDYNDFRWAALLEMYSGSSNIGKAYKKVKGYWHNHMYPNTYQAIRVIDGPSEIFSSDRSNLLYVEWCTGEQELYNMTVDPHQIHNLLYTDLESSANTIQPKNETPISSPMMSPDYEMLLPLIHRLNKLLTQLGDCKGSECYDLSEFDKRQRRGTTHKKYPYNNPRVESNKLSLESLQSSIRTRIPCHNPPNFPSVVENNGDTNVNLDNLRRRPFAYDLPVPDPFQHGFPFSDGDDIGKEQLETWEAFEHYFY